MISGLPVSNRLSRAGTWLVFAGIAFAVGSYYLWALRAAGYRFDWKNDQGGYYNYLGRAFASGRLELPIKPSPALLALPNPWDPAVDDSLKMHDMALFRGRYYLYHGAGPAVLLFAPWRLITGHDLPERFALFVLCFGGFLFSCGVLMQWLVLAGARIELPLLASMLLALGLCQAVPYLLSRVWVYEIAIGGGYFCISAALYFLTMGIRAERKSYYWLGASGLMFGLAISCRPHLGLAGVCAFGALALLFARSRARLPGILAFAAAFALVGAAVAGYNYGRFGDPFEFGIRYLLSGPNQNRIRLASENILPGLYFWLACHPDLNAVFPWVRLAFRYPFNTLAYPFPKEYFMEATVGAVYLAPFLIGLVLFPLMQRVAKAGAGVVQVLSGTVLIFSAAILLFLAATGFTTQRYTVDFLPPMVLASLVAVGVHIGRSGGRTRTVLQTIFFFSIGWGIVANLALGISGPFDEMLKNRPVNYVRIAGWFSPLEKFRPRMNPAIEIVFTARFVPTLEHLREPLVTMGHQAYRYFLYVEHSAGKLRLVSQCDHSTVAWPIAERDDGQAHIRLAFSGESGKLTAIVNGGEVLIHDIEMLVTAPAQITIGENRIDPGVTAARFTGSLAGIFQSVR